MTTKRGQGRNTSTKRRLTVYLTKADQAAVEIMKAATGALTTSDALREALKLSLTTIATVMRTHNLKTYAELREFIFAAAAQASTTTNGDSHDDQANNVGTQVPSSP